MQDNSPCNQNSIGFVVYGSAQTSLLNYNNVYSKAFVWDGISSNVNVRIAMYSSGMPTTNFFGVIGDDMGSTLGKTNYYDANGNGVSKNGNWYSVVITMNNGSIFNSASNPSTAAAKTFIHEVGHALKLSHPVVNTSYHGTTYNGYPYAVMNQGFPKTTTNGVVSNAEVASSVVTHDRENLIAKWGS